MAQNDSFTKILLTTDGSNGSTTFTDSNVGGSAHTWTAGGNAQISTAQSKFGGASGLFDGTSDFVTTPDSADYTLGAGDWTFDCWFYRSGGDGTRRFFFGQATTGNSGITIGGELDASNVLHCIVSTDGTGATITSVTGTTAITAVGWHHLAFLRTGNILRMFLDGAQEGGDVGFASAVHDSAAGLWSIGSLGGLTTLTWNGHIDEARLSVGVARWTANFTPPGSAYVDERANAGSYSLTGNAAAFRGEMAAAAGSYALTGNAATLAAALGAEAGSYVLTGNDATFSSNLAPAAGDYALTGNDAVLTGRLTVDAGAYLLTGTPIIERLTSTMTTLQLPVNCVLAGDQSFTKRSRLGRIGGQRLGVAAVRNAFNE